MLPDILFKIQWGGVFAQAMLVQIDDGWAMLTDVYVHPWIRGKGHSHTVIKKAMAYADRNELSVMLKVKKYGKGGLKTSSLVQLYSQYGFEFINENGIMIRSQRWPSTVQRSKRSQHLLHRMENITTQSRKPPIIRLV